MGTFNYDVNIDKNVDIDIDVDLNVDKFVQSFTNINGYLAVAEAAADAFGGPGGGTCQETFRNFIIDDFTDEDLVLVFGDGEDDPPGPIDPTGNPVESVQNSGAFTETSIPGGIFTIELGDPQRTSEVFNIPGQDDAFASIGVDITPGKITLNTESNTLSNDVVAYSADINGDDLYGEPEDAFSVVVPCDEPLDLTDPRNNLTLEDARFSPEGTDTTIRLEIAITDADGDEAVLRAYADSTFVDDTEIVLPLGLFTGDLPSAGEGAELLTGFFATGDNTTADIQFDQIVGIEFRVLGDSALADPAHGPVASENPTEDAFDVEFGLFEINSVCEECEPGQGALAETETFAQVDQFSGFTEAFSMSLAATNSADFDFI